MIKHIPDTITSMNLLSGLMGVIFTMEGHLEYAFPLMLLAAVFDFCDGLAARLLDAYSPIGKELDSLADLVSFGVLPSLMLFKTMQLAGCCGFLSYVPLFLAIMSALRLARFNVDLRQGSDFIEVATPTAAMLCGSLTYFIAVHPGTFLDAWAGSSWFLPALSVILGLLLVSEIPMFGMKIGKGHRLLDTKRVVFLILAAVCILATVLLHMDWSLAVLSVFCIYIAENLVVAVLAKVQ